MRSGTDEEDPGENEGTPQEHPLEGHSMGSSRAEGELTVPGVTYSQVTSEEWSLQRSQQELKRDAQVHRQQVQLTKTKHQLDQEAEDNKTRRKRESVVFWVALVGLVAFVAVGFLLTAFSTDEGNQDFGRGIVLTVVGGVVGYVIRERRST